LPDASVSALNSSEEKIPLLLHLADDGELLMEVGGDRPVRRGVYLFAFRYRDNLAARGLIKRHTDAVQLTWVGPRVENGIDSAKVTFQLPKAQRAPSLWSDPDDDAPTDFSLGGGTVLVSQLRRTVDADQLELVKAHVAKGEPAVWQVNVSSEAFSSETPLARSPDAAGSPMAGPRAKPDRPIGHLLLWGVALAIGYALLAALKWRATARFYTKLGASLRPLIPLPRSWGPALGGVLLGAALVLFLFVRSFSFAGCLLGAAMLLTTLRSPRLSTKVRGPGEWKSCSKASLPAARKVPLLVRLFDAHFLLGFAVCMGGLGGIVTLALWRLPMDPYIAAAILSGAVALLPLFTTGGAHLALQRE
jgi:hypothetical protein